MKSVPAKNHLAILGIRGIPAAHGGFETFAERLALYLVERGWLVTVYCQEEGEGELWIDVWKGVNRVHIPVSQAGAKGTVLFDWKSTIHALARERKVLTLGYNTALFGVAYRLKGIVNVINMDGIEWQRDKWNTFERFWLYINEWAGCWLGNHLIADHPEIRKHLMSRVSPGKISMIPYGADEVIQADFSLIESYGLKSKAYALVIARPEPENSILEIVTAFSRLPARGHKLVVLGKFTPEDNSYHEAVMAAAGENVIFLGAIYDKSTVRALRFHCGLYIHGHTVGGTNPSLVEALGAGCPVLAHDNRFNRWVAGSGAEFFSTVEECIMKLSDLLCDPQRLASMSEFSRLRFRETFRWEQVLAEYERLLLSIS